MKPFCDTESGTFSSESIVSNTNKRTKCREQRMELFCNRLSDKKCEKTLLPKTKTSQNY